MKKPSARIRAIIGIGAVPVAIVVAGSLVWQSSYASFSATTRSAGASWAAGSVALTDDDKGSALFNLTNVVPGDSGQKCIVVTSNATVPGEVRNYAANLSSPTGLSEHITFKMEIGTGGSFNSCTGFVPNAGTPAALPMATIAPLAHDYASGDHAWVPSTGSPSRTYRITWSFDTTGMTQAQVDALQGSSFTSDLVWEFRSSATATPAA